MVYNVIEKDVIEKIIMSSDEYKKGTNKVMGVQRRKNRTRGLLKYEETWRPLSRMERCDKVTPE